MFNRELKERFIKGYSASISVRDTCLSIFNITEKYEIGWDADICTKDTKDVQPIIDEISGLRTRGKISRVGVLKEYAKWCLSEGVPYACDGLLHVDVTGSSKIKTQMVANPIQLQSYLDVICDAESEQTLDNIYRCYYWLAYGGVSEEDIFKIKVSDVDLTEMMVNYKDGVLIYRESVPAFKNCATLTQFVYKHPNYGMDKVVYKNRAEGDELIRGIRSVPSVQAMRVELSRRSKKSIEAGKTTLKLSYFRVWLSGLFYRMYERERAGYQVDFSSVASDFMEGKTYNLVKSRNTPEAYKRRVAGDYLRDYEFWKETFS